MVSTTVPDFKPSRLLALDISLKLAKQSYVDTQYSENKSQNTIDNYMINLDTFIKFTGDVLLKDIDTQTVRAYLALRAKGHSSSTIHQAYRVLRSFFNWCVAEGYLECTPMTNIKSPRLEKKVIPEYTQDEVHKLIGSCDSRSFLGSRNKSLISVLLDTGLRRAEIIGIRMGDFDLHTGSIRVRGKGDKERIVHVENKAKQSIIRYKVLRELHYPKNDYLFLGNDLKPLTGNGLTTIIRKLCLRAGVTAYKVVHKFRHSYAIETLRNGGRLDVLKWELGHANVNVTMRYLSAINDSDAQVDHQTSSPGNKWL